MGGRRIGAILLTIGVVLVAVGGAGAAGLIGGGGAATAVVSPIPTVTSTPLPATSPAPTAPASPSPDPMVAIRAFFADLVTAIQTGDQPSLAARLDPAVVARFGTAACDAELAGRSADPTYAIAISTITGPGPWDYTTDGRSTSIPDAWTVSATVTATGTSAARTLHVAFADGRVTWFTDCGTPLPS